MLIEKLIVSYPNHILECLNVKYPPFIYDRCAQRRSTIAIMNDLLMDSGRTVIRKSVCVPSYRKSSFCTYLFVSLHFLSVVNGIKCKL